MTDFKDRQRGEEAKYVHDQQTEFKVMARRNKLLGLWAADLLGLTGSDAEAYAKTVVLSDLEEAGECDCPNDQRLLRRNRRAPCEIGRAHV